jgi:2-keto-4-pentenoate hydratase
MPAWAGVSEMVDSLVWTFSSGQPVVVLSQANPDLDVQTAYQVQKGYVQKRLATDKVAGFKAGLTTEGAQKAFSTERYFIRFRKAGGFACCGL